RKLLVRCEFVAARRKCPEMAEIPQLLLGEALHVRHHFVGNSVLKHPLVRHMRRHIGGVCSVTGKRIPGAIWEPEPINELSASRTITLFAQRAGPSEHSSKTVCEY